MWLKKIQCTDKAPRPSISNVIWFLSSDTICQLNQLFSNSEVAMLSKSTEVAKGLAHPSVKYRRFGQESGVGGDTWLCRGSTILKLGSAHNLDLIWRRHILLGTIQKLEKI